MNGVCFSRPFRLDPSSVLFATNKGSGNNDAAVGIMGPSGKKRDRGPRTFSLGNRVSMDASLCFEGT